VNCANGHSVAEGAKFCPQCGGAVVPAPSPATSLSPGMFGMTCPNGHVLHQTATFCPYCAGGAAATRVPAGALETRPALALAEWIYVALGVVAAVATFLPWAQLDFEGQTVFTQDTFQFGTNGGFSITGVIVIGLAVVVVVGGVLRLRRITTGNTRFHVIAAPVILAVYVGFQYGTIHNWVNSVNNGPAAGFPGAQAMIGYGFWLAIVAGAAAVVLGIVIQRMGVVPVPGVTVATQP
jgi:hypothetical protein